MSNKREREKRRQERLAQEARAQSGERRKKLLQIGAGAVFLAIIAVVVVIVVASSDSDGGDAENLQQISAAESVVAGIPQEKLVLGDPDAPVELIEYGDLQCPACKAYAEEILPPVIENAVKTGKAKMVFRNYLIIGEESLPAGAAAIAAGNQGRGWSFLEVFYRNQGAENSGYVTDEFLEAVAKAAGVKDIERFNRERKSKAVERQAERTTEQAATLGFTGTPSFAIKGPNSNGLELLGSLGSPEEFEAEIERVS